MQITRQYVIIISKYEPQPRHRVRKRKIGGAFAARHAGPERRAACWKGLCDMIYAEERYKKILNLLAENGRVDTAELTAALDASRETVRRDLNELSKMGLLVKTHGGAIPAANTSLGLFAPLKARKTTRFPEKQTLCAYAARAVREYDTVFVDNSTTTAQIIHSIPKQFKVTFITNSISLMTEFTRIHNPNWNVICLGGILDYATLSTFRRLAMDNLSRFKPNKSFLSCHGIDEEFTVTDTSIDDVEIKQYIMKVCKETYLLADSSKLPRDGVVRIGDSAEFYSVITNEDVNPLFLGRLTSHGCKVQLAPGG